MMTLPKPWLLALLTLLFVVAGVAGGPANAVEPALMLQMAKLRMHWPAITDMAAGLTNLGGAYATLGLATAASAWLLMRRAPAAALLVALTVLLERSLVEGLKVWIGRPRPHFEVAWLPHSLAFPSGHSANSMTAFLVTAVIVAPARLRRTAVAAAIMLSVLVGLTRVWLGVHWPSDVIGGWSLGMLAVAAALAIGQRSGVLPLKQQHEVVGRHGPPLDEDQSA